METHTGRTERARALGAKGSPALWVGVFAPPAAWFVALTAMFFLVQWVCGDGPALLLHLVPAAMLATALGGGASAWRVWRRIGVQPPSEESGPAPRTRLLAAVGVLGGALFSLIILLQWLAVVLLEPCHGGGFDPP